MPSRHYTTKEIEEREDRKRRQEKFKKRTKSLFSKTKLLAKDTDAWVALIVRDRAGHVRSFRSSDSFYWPESIKDLTTGNPSGAHEFLEKQAISGCWKEVGQNDESLVDANTDEEDVSAISVIPLENSGTTSVTQCDMDANVEGGGNAWRHAALNSETADEMVFTPGDFEAAQVNAIRESDIAALNSESADEMVLVPRNCETAQVNVIEESDIATPKTAMEVAATHNSGAMLDLPEEINRTEFDPECDMGVVRNPIQQDATNPIYMISQCHNPLSSGGLGGWQMVNWPRVDAKELLQNWDWVFQNRFHQKNA